MKQNVLLVVASLLLIPPLLTSCAHPRSNKVEKEVVVLKLRPANTQQRSPVAAAAAGVVAGFAVDYVKGRIEAEAKKLERQYGQSELNDEFWSIYSTETNTLAIGPNLGGFVLQRFTKGLPQDKGVAAMEFSCIFRPLSEGRFFYIVPEILILREAKAKIVNRDALVDMTITVAVDAMWIDKAQTAHTDRIAVHSFEVENVKLGDTNGVPNLLQRKGGIFPAIPISANSAGKFPWEQADFHSAHKQTNALADGIFKLTVAVTERDASKAKEYLEKAAKFLGEQKDKIVEKAKGAAE